MARESRLLRGYVVALVLALVVGLASVLLLTQRRDREVLPLQRCAVSDLLVPECGAWWGLAPLPEQGQSLTEAVSDFESRIQRRTSLLHVYHRGRELFPTAEERRLARSGPRLLFVNWRPGASTSWREVAAGADDAYLSRLAHQLQAARIGRVLLSVEAEPEDLVYSKPGMSPADFAAMFRHVITRLRAAGAPVVSVVDYIGSPRWLARPWFDQLYPGSDVVDWVGFDPFLQDPQPVARRSLLVNALLGQDGSGAGGFLAWRRLHAPGKPVVLGEWGVMGDQGKADLFRAMTAMPRRHPEIKAYCYWQSTRSFRDSQGRERPPTAVDTSGAALDAYRQLGDRRYFRPRLP